jgi:MFS family permease
MSHTRRVIAFINVGHALDHLFMLVYTTAVLTMAAEFGRSFGEMIGLSLGGFIAFGAGSLPAGWLGDRWSRRNMMAVFFFGTGAAAILASFVSTPTQVFLALTLLGAFAAIYHPVGTAMLVAHAERTGREIGINGVWGNMGVALAALVTGALSQWLGWRWAFALPGIVALIVGAAFVALVPDVPAPKRAGARKAFDVPRHTMQRVFLVLLVVSIAGSLIFNGVNLALPKVVEDRVAALAQSPALIGVVVFAIYALGSLSQLIIGRLVDRHPLRAVFVPVAMLYIPTLFLAIHAQDMAILVLALGFVFAMFGQVTINDTMVARYTTDEWRGRVYALRYTVSFVGTAMAVPLVGRLRDGFGGFEWVFVVLGAIAVLICTAALAFPYRREEIAPQPSAAAAE